jgi:hypothetical protein
MMDYNSHTCMMCGRNFPAKLNIVREVVVDIHCEEPKTDFYIRGAVRICHNCRRDLRRWVYAIVPNMTDRGVGADLKPELTRRDPELAIESGEEEAVVNMLLEGVGRSDEAATGPDVVRETGNGEPKNGNGDVQEGKKRK